VQLLTELLVSTPRTALESSAALDWHLGRIGAVLCVF
jgi:hypothetical protein